MGCEAGRETHMPGPAGNCTYAQPPRAWTPEACVGDAKTNRLGGFSQASASRPPRRGRVQRGRAAWPRLDTEI